MGFSKGPLIAVKVVNPFFKGFKLSITYKGIHWNFINLACVAYLFILFFSPIFFIGLACVLYVI